jgi:hypothetical protein
LRFGAQVDDTTLAQGVALFRLSARVDSLDFSYKNLYTANIGRLSSGYRLEAPTNGRVNTQTARISFRGLNFRMVQERMRVSAGRTSANIRIVPNPEKPTSPVANIRMSLDSLNFRQSGMGVRLNSSQLNLALKPLNQIVQEPRDTTLNQGERRRGRDTTISEAERQQQRLARLQDMSSDEFIAKLMGYMDVLDDTTVDIAQKFMSEFSYECTLVFDTFRLRMPEFPMPILVLSTEVDVTSRVITLDSAQIIVGNTDMMASGTLENFRRAMAGRGTLRGNLDIKSTKMDANQLIFAINNPTPADTNRRRGEGRRGEGERTERVDRFQQMDNESRERREAREREGSGSGGSGEQRGRRSERNLAENAEAAERVEDIEFIIIPDSVLIAEKTEDNSMFEVAFEAPQEASLFMIPKNLNLILNVDIDTMFFGTGVMTKLDGEAEIRDEFLRLNRFILFNSGGQIEMTLAYKAQSLKEANAWFNVNIEKTEIQELVDMYPEIRTELDLVNSLEGLVDFSLTASAILDSAMNVDLSRTIASAEMHGQNLVLLDGENFATIAKTLRFRNKERNMVDSLSVSFVVRDNQVQIFPFILVMDRYRLAVEGVQNLDMSYNYHISVLKSPIPFTMGFDISGKGSDMNFPRPVRERLKDLETPATSVNIQKTINVQQEFRRILDYELSRIVGTNEN